MPPICAFESRKALPALDVETTIVVVMTVVSIRYGVEVVMVAGGGEIVTVVNSKNVFKEVKVVV